jgi:hypothetical protein
MTLMALGVRDRRRPQPYLVAPAPSALPHKRGGGGCIAIG